MGVLKDLPDNLHKGFYEEFKFDLLKTDAKNVKDAAEQGLSTCGVTTAQCVTGALPTFPPYNTVANTSLSLQKITDAFDNSLSIVKKVSSDKFFSVGPLKDTAKDLEEITNETKKLEGEDRCLVTNEAFCEIYKSSGSLTEGADMATGKIDEFQDSDAVKMFKDNADLLNAMHGIPYAMVIALLFFSCFWYKDAACCCCGGSCLGCVVLIFHAIFWLVSIVGCAIVTSIGYAFTEGQEQVDLKGAGLAGDPNMKELLDHLSSTYPGFWEIVITPLEAPLLEIYHASFFFSMFCVAVFLYGCCVCIIRPYTGSADEARAIG